MSPVDAFSHSARTAQDQAAAEQASATPHPDRCSLLSMRPLVGDALQLDCGAPLSSQKTFVRLIGYIKDRILIVSAPVINGIRLELLEHDQVLVRGFSGINAYAFRASVVRSSRLPFDHVYLSYPESVFGRSVRRSQRMRTELTAQLEAGGSVIDVGIADLGALGALISATEELETGQPMELKLNLEVHEYAVDLAVNIEIVNHSVNGELHKYGIRFIDPDPHTAMLLKAFVYQHLVEQPELIL